MPLKNLVDDKNKELRESGSNIDLNSQEIQISHHKIQLIDIGLDIAREIDFDKGFPSVAEDPVEDFSEDDLIPTVAYYRPIKNFLKFAPADIQNEIVNSIGRYEDLNVQADIIRELIDAPGLPEPLVETLYGTALVIFKDTALEMPPAPDGNTPLMSAAKNVALSALTRAYASGQFSAETLLRHVGGEYANAIIRNIGHFKQAAGDERFSKNDHNIDTDNRITDLRMKLEGIRKDKIISSYNRLQSLDELAKSVATEIDYLDKARNQPLESKPLSAEAAVSLAQRGKNMAARSHLGRKAILQDALADFSKDPSGPFRRIPAAIFMKAERLGYLQADLGRNLEAMKVEDHKLAATIDEISGAIEAHTTTSASQSSTSPRASLALRPRNNNRDAGL